MDAETFSAAALSAPHPLAAAAGRDVLVEGGTAAEAALAAAMALAVVLPGRAGLGGDALWLFREAGPRGRVRALDARGAVAAVARPSFYRERGFEAVPARGPGAVLVAPGAAAGWIEALALGAATGGRMPVARLLAPALALARDGWDLGTPEAAALARAAPNLAAEPGFAAAFLDGGRAPEAGARLRAPALADALGYLAHAGLEAFYRGDVGRELATDLDALSCPLGRADLRAAAARWREPRVLDLARHALAVPPTGAGLRAALSFGLAGGLAQAGFDVAAADGFGRWHGLVEACRAADRMAEEADAAGRDGAALLDPARLARHALKLDRARAGRAEAPGAPLVEEAAASIVAVDREGAAVSAVFTMGGAFGSGVVSGRTGVLMGDRGALFALDPGEGPMLRPGRRAPLRAIPAMLSSPRDGRVAALAALGEGAPAAATQIAERLARGMGSAEALAAPRFALGAVPDGRGAALLVDGTREPGPVRALRAAGHEVVEAEGPLWAAGVALRDGAGRVSAAADGGAAEVI